MEPAMSDHRYHVRTLNDGTMRRPERRSDNMGAVTVPDLLRRVLPTRTRVSGVLHAPFRRLDPSGWRVRRWQEPVAEPLVLIAIYRSRYAAGVLHVVEQAAAMDADIRLWALDEEAPELADHTLGAGRAPRTELMNELWAARDCHPDATVVLWDDDIVFERSDLAGLLRAVRRSGFDLAQPTHAPGAHRGWRVTYSRYLSIARWVGWVEVGPVVVVRPSVRDQILPFPPDFGMGWGVELVWRDLAVAGGWRLGMVDAVGIHHLAVVGTDYDVVAERARVAGMLRQRGHDIASIQEHRGTWRPWRRHPPWGEP